jgi:hypothetical protein
MCRLNGSIPQHARSDTLSPEISRSVSALARALVADAVEIGPPTYM